MSNRPPREGARWGEDPAPEPVEQPEPPKPPAEYLLLCEEYGEANVEFALGIYRKIKGEYPHLPILKNGDLPFAKDVLHSSKVTIETAARDGRSHTMPETLKIIQDHLGKYLVQNPELLGVASLTWNYGDEGTGKAAKQRKEEADGVVGAIIIVVVISAFFAWLMNYFFDVSFLKGFIGVGIVSAVLVVLDAMYEIF